MTELIVFPDPVALVIAALDARLSAVGFAGVPALATIPASRPARFVKVSRVGGVSQELVVDRAMLNLEAWAPTDAQSLALAQAARAVVNGMEGTVVDGVPIYTVNEFSGPANLPDPASHTPRHTWTVEVFIRGTAA